MVQERQHTGATNTYYDLVSVLYHSLKEAQTCSIYIKDAQQAGDQNMAMFFQQIQQNANSQAEKARQMLSVARM